jgi:hypothetical protein
MNGDQTMCIRFQRGDEDGLRNALAALDHGEEPELHFEVIFDNPDASYTCWGNSPL